MQHDTVSLPCGTRTGPLAEGRFVNGHFGAGRLADGRFADEHFGAEHFTEVKCAMPLYKIHSSYISLTIVSMYFTISELSHCPSSCEPFKPCSLFRDVLSN